MSSLRLRTDPDYEEWSKFNTSILFDARLREGFTKTIWVLLYKEQDRQVNDPQF
jgi:hypothetical protein